MSDTPAAPEEGQDVPASATDEAPVLENPVPEVAEQAPTPKGVQKRLDEFRRQLGDTQRMNERLLSLVEQTVRGKAPEVQTPSGPPDRNSYADHDQYLEALADYKVSEKFEGLKARVAQEKAQESAKQRESAWTKKLEQAASKHADFEDVVFDEKLPVSAAMAEAMQESDVGPEIAYWLGKNPAEAQRIAGLSAIAQAREIGKIESRIGEPAPKKETSKAPAPIEPVGKGKTSDSDIGSAKSMDEFVRRRETELKGLRRG
jgi:hypothetical protein